MHIICTHSILTNKYIKNYMRDFTHSTIINKASGLRPSAIVNLAPVYENTDLKYAPSVITIMT